MLLVIKKKHKRYMFLRYLNIRDITIIYKINYNWIFQIFVINILDKIT